MIADVVVFWIVAIAAIALVRAFPGSLPARVLYTPLGPAARRGETRARGWLRWASQCALWTGEAIALYGGGAWLRAHSAAIDESVALLAFFTVVVPAAGLAAAAGALLALVAALRAWLAAREMPAAPAARTTTDSTGRPPRTEGKGVAADVRDRG